MSDEIENNQTEINAETAGNDKDLPPAQGYAQAGETLEPNEGPRPEEPIAGNENPDDPLERLSEENASLKDKLMRTMAEMENLRRRTEREKAESSKYAISKFASEVLVIGDNISRALETVTRDSEQNNPTLNALLEGLKVTERELGNVMERHGIESFDPLGEPFNPNHHQAMFEIPNPEIASGTVVEVVQLGYMIGDRVLRAAMVGVSKGGAKIPRNKEEQPQHPQQTEDPADQAPQSQAPGPTEDLSPPSGENPPPAGSAIDKSA